MYLFWPQWYETRNQYQEEIFKIEEIQYTLEKPTGKKIIWDKQKWKHNVPKLTKYSKNHFKKKGYKWNIKMSNKQPSFTPKEL